MNVATIFPLWPGNIGLLQAAVALPLREYGVPYATGFAYGLVLQVVEMSVGVGVGLIFLAREGLSFASLKRMEQEEEDERRERPRARCSRRTTTSRRRERRRRRDPASRRADSVSIRPCGGLEPRDAGAVQLLAALPELDRLVERHVTALEPADDLVELALQLLERALVAHGRTSSTRAAERAGGQLDVDRVADRDRRGVAEDATVRADDRVSALHRRLRRDRAQPRARRVERRPASLEEQARSGTQASRRRVESLPVTLGLPADTRLERDPRAAERRDELVEVGEHEPHRGGRRRRADVGREVAERRVLLVPDRRHHRHRARGDGAHDGLRREREEILEAAAAAGDHDDVDRRMLGEPT